MRPINIKHKTFFIVIFTITCAVPILRMNLLNKQHTHINQVKYVESYVILKWNVVLYAFLSFRVFKKEDEREKKENKRL